MAIAVTRLVRLNALIMPSKRNVVFVVLFAVAAVASMFLIAIYALLVTFSDDDIQFGDAVAVVEVFGEIYYDRNKETEIKEHREDDNIKAVLVHINSPGGGVMGSQAIYHALRKVREEKPVVAVMASVAASGGYYIACAADTIVATEGTVTGSIGVIAAYLHTQELFRKVGLDVTVLKSGKLKDVGSPHRAMTEEERVYLGALLDDVYDQFLVAVSEGRGLPMDRVRELAEGRLYTGRQAVEAGLVDRLGGYEEGLRMAAAMAGISGEPRVVRRRPRRTLIERILDRTIERLPLVRDDGLTLKYIMP